MKSILLALGLSLWLVIPAWTQNSGPHNPISSAAPPQPANPAFNANTLTAAEWQELRAAREAAFKAKPDLRLNAEKLSKEMHAFLVKLNAAILKTDPHVAPVVARLEGRGPGPGMQPLPNQGRPSNLQALHP